MNPTGANPTGIVYSIERKEEIYKLAQKYDFLIVEDDACYFIHFLDQVPKSFFSMDTDGRVIRLDSFSKMMSGGIRLGIVTAPKPVIEKLKNHMSSSNVHTSALSQVRYKYFFYFLIINNKILNFKVTKFLKFYCFAFNV